MFKDLNLHTIIINVIITIACMYTILHITKIEHYSIPPTVLLFGTMMLILLIKIWAPRN